MGSLDIFDSWDSSLALVMAGSAPRRDLPIARVEVTDAGLVGGAALYGVGWGLAGWCLGPALLPLGQVSWQALVIVAAMGGGLALFRFVPRPLGQSAV